MDRDGRADVVVVNSGSGVVQVFRGPGDGTLEAPASFSSGASSFPEAIVVANLNADAFPDVAVANDGDDDVRVLLNNGSGGLGTATDFTARPAVRDQRRGTWTRTETSTS